MSALKQLETFVAIVSLGSMSAAARQERVVPAVIGRRLDSLEKRLGVKLLIRTTRSISLTQEGGAFYEDCQRILQDLRDAEAAVASGSTHAHGQLHLLAPATYGRLFVAPHVAEFQRLYPDIRITLDLSDRVVDLARERIDCAIRISNLEDSSLVAVRLAAMRRVLVASPAYLERRGVPETPADIDQHDCLLLMGDSQSKGWTFKVDEQVVQQKVRSALECNDGAILYEWALQGMGLAWRPLWEVKDALASGKLVRVLDQYASADDPVYAVVAQRKYLPSRVRLFIEHLRSVYARKGYWE
ncbi:MAG: LysR family transcriptional regulator [Burkholderiaceae bacterium]|nr:LysR family transcriptional regulator [Burkholderiaceae bacterium]